MSRFRKCLRFTASPAGGRQVENASRIPVTIQLRLVSIGTANVQQEEFQTWTVHRDGGARKRTEISNLVEV
jgi:hypothetical protein